MPNFPSSFTLYNTEIKEEDKELFLRMLPALLERVRREVIYEYACTDEFKMWWAKEIFNTAIKPYL